MAERQYRTLTKRTVDRLAVSGKDAGFWDNELPGFGVRVYPSGKKIFVVQTRALGRSKRVSLGQHGDTNFSVDHARRKAADVIARIKVGQPAVPPEPAPDPTVADLAERYEREYVAMHCKPLTVRHYRLMLRKHIVPALGERLVADVECKDILAFHNTTACTTCLPSPTGRPTSWSRCSIWRMRGAGVPPAPTRAAACPASGSRSTTRTKAPAWSTSTTPGTGCASAPGSKTSARMTFVTRSPPAPSPSGRACR